MSLLPDDVKITLMCKENRWLFAIGLDDGIVCFDSERL